MSSVDDRIVNMTFNNQQFNQGAADSQKALEGLDKTIANTGKGGGLKEMGNAVDGVKLKFSALQVAGVAAIATIATKATNAAISMVKGMTLDPIMQGFQEYQTNLNSIQTVMSNTGEGVKTVNSYMEQLNKFYDQTIYNFSEMARNIGTFTAAGVDLKTATSSIQGIANLAALSGSNSQQASTAMYQLSQAIAAGRVGLMDWNSVVNAGMGGKIFQTALAQTGVAMGQISDNALDLGGKFGKLTIAGQSFRESISSRSGEAWLNGDTLTNTLEILDGRLARSKYVVEGYSESWIDNKIAQEQAALAAKGYSKEQIASLTDVANRAYEAATVVKTFPQLMQVTKESIGSIWANSFQILLGNFNQSKRLWSNVSKYITGPNGFISKMGAAWTGMLRGFVEEGGRNKVIVGFSRMFTALGRVMKTVKKAFQDVFPSEDGSGLANLAKGFAQFTKILAVHKDSLKNLRSIFGGLFAVLHIGVTILKGLGSAVLGFFDGISSGVDKGQGGLLSFLGSIGEILIAFDKWFSSGDKISNVMGGIGTAVGMTLQPILAVAGVIGGLISSIVTGGTKIQQVTFGMSDSFQNLNHIFIDIQQKVIAFKNSLAGLSGGDVDFKAIAQSVGELAGGLVTSGVDLGKALVDGIIEGIESYGPQTVNAILAVAQGLIDGFKAAMGIASPSTVMAEMGGNIIEGLIEGITALIPMVLKAIIALGQGIKDAFTGLFSGIGNMDAFDFVSLLNAIFTGSLLVMMNKITFGLGSFVGLGPQLIGTFKDLRQSLTAYQDSLKYKALREIAISIALLAGSILLLSLIPPDKIAIGVGAIAVMMKMLVGSMTALAAIAKGEMSIPVLAFSMVLLSGALVQLAIAVGLFGMMPLDVIAQGMGGMAIGLGILLGALVAFTKLAGPTEIAGMASSILILAFAMNVLVTAVLAFGVMPFDVLVQGLGGMAIGLAILVAAMLGLDKIKGSVEGLAASILIISAAMVVMATAVGLLGAMSLEQLAKGLGAMAIGLGLMVGAILILAPMSAQVAIVSAGILAMGQAMLFIAGAMLIISAISWEGIGKGLVVIAGAFAILLAAAFAAQYVAPGLIILAFALNLMGAALLYAGLGMLAFATGFAIMVAVGTAGIALLAVAFNLFLALLPQLAMQLAASFIAFLEVLAAASPRIREAVGKIFQDMIGVITDSMPVIATLFTTLLNTAIDVIVATVPRFIEAGLTILDSFLAGLAEHIPNIAKSVSKLVTEFFSALGDHINDIVRAGTDFVVDFLDGMGKAAAEITMAIGQFILDVLDAIGDAIEIYTPQIQDAGLRIAGLIINGMTGGLAGKIKDAIETAAQAALDNLPGPLGEVAGSIFGRGKAAGPGKLFNQAEQAVIAANTLANAIQSGGDADVEKAAIAFEKADDAAAIARVKADAADAAADEAERKANKNRKNQKLQEKARLARAEADRKEAAAQAKADKADAKANALSDAIAFSEADTIGKADMRADEAVELAELANAELAKAEAQRKKAKELKGKAKKDMEKKAEASAKRAKALALAAAAADQEAKDLYADEFATQLLEYEAEQAKEAEDAAYDAADNVGKSEILKKRAAENQKIADANKALSAQALAEAKAAEAANDPAKALEMLEKAEEYAAIAKSAAAEAKAQSKEAESVLTGGTTGGSGAGGIQPSKTVLEDAAKAVDRYTASLAMATELAGGQQSVVQYNQNIYSPVAVDAPTVYRQTKNIVAAQEIKMGSLPSVTPSNSGSNSGWTPENP